MDQYELNFTRGQQFVSLKNPVRILERNKSYIYKAIKLETIKFWISNPCHQN